MLKLYITLCISLSLPIICFAELANIEQDLSNCLKGLIDNYAMAECTSKASQSANLEITNIVQSNGKTNSQLLKNQILWNKYKTSTDKTINLALEKSFGNLNSLLAINNLYLINKNRLRVLEYITEASPYKKEKYISEELENCLQTTKNNEITKCYNDETKRYSTLITNYLNNLRTSLSNTDYQNLELNHQDWIKYKNDTELLLKSSSISEITKSQIIETIYAERNGQLFNLMNFYNN